MAITLGTRGNDGKSLIRDTKKFKENLDEVDFSKAEQRPPDRTKGGKKTWVYGKKSEPEKIDIHPRI
jgi:hypothetical protein